MRHKLILIGLLASASLLVAGQGHAQTVVQYTGSLMIGFGDSDNFGLPVPERSNNAIPVCAVNGNPFLAYTFGSLPMYGQAVQNGVGPGATLMFKGHGRPLSAGQTPSLKGGAERHVSATCNLAIPPFANPRLRSRIQAAGEVFPGTRGPWRGTGMTAVPAVSPDWTVGPNQGFRFPGANLNTLVPFFGGNGAVSVKKGPRNYGGAIQYQGGGGVQLGVNVATMTGGGMTLMTFGVVNYINGFLPTDPTIMGTDATGVNAPTTATAFPNGLIAGRLATMAFRTPGPMGTVNQQGNIIHTPMGAAVVSPVAFNGAFFEWTTGTARHSDMVGDFVTNRSAMGQDVAVVGGPNGTTRRLQLVSPWSASIKLVGPFGLPIPQLGFGGLAVLKLNIQPAPEPGLIAMLGVGIAGIAGLAATRRRSH